MAEREERRCEAHQQGLDSPPVEKQLIPNFRSRSLPHPGFPTVGSPDAVSFSHNMRLSKLLFYAKSGRSKN